MKTGIVSISANVEYLPLALLYLKSSLKNENVEPPILLNFNFEDSPQKIAKEIIDFNFDTIGFSVYVWNIRIIKEVVREIKSKNPKTAVIFGGPEVSPRAKEVMEEIPEIDFAVVDEGEFAFKELILSIKTGKNGFAEIKGLCYRNGDKIILTEERGSITPLDLIQYPFSETKFEKENNFKVLPVETMRGCRYKCRFCFYSKGKNKIRFFSDERVEESLFYALKESSCEKIYLMDPDFTSNRERAKKICSFISDNNENNKPFHTEIRAEEVDEETALFLKKANIADVEVGIQSTN
ncbi:MAG: cobalamin-dependent protein, partial [Acidobacteria bacterium]|nr:cobalamin-dependent protein [Acidobacteriota bacterium]